MFRAAIFATIGLTSALTSVGVSQEKTFRQRLELFAEPRAPFGARPKAKDRHGRDTFTVRLPGAFSVNRDFGSHGLKVVQKNFGGMDETDFEVKPVDHGVTVYWRLRNPHSTPVTGRRAFMTVEIKGTRKAKMALSAKYLSLRERFLDEFYFDGRVATWVDNSFPGRKVNFGDQTIYMGQAMMVFSTEMAILNDAGLKSDDARRRVEELLDGIEDLELKANVRYKAQPPGRPRGLIVRDDIVGPEDERLKNRFKVVESDWQHQEKENASPSGDQLFGLMYGLYCVTEFSGDVELSKRAKAISNRLFDYAMDSDFELRLPNGNSTRRGSDMRWLASLFNGLNKSISGDDNFKQSRIRIGPVRAKLNGIGGFWDDHTTPKRIAALTGKSITIPVVEKELALNSFSLHILLMALAPSNVWTRDEIEDVALKCNHELSVLLYCVAHSMLPQHIDEERVRKMLAACAEDGPREGLPSESGWQRDSRWIRCTKIFRPNDGGKEFNGLDWLLLHNFNELAFRGP